MDNNFKRICESYQLMSGVNRSNTDLISITIEVDTARKAVGEPTPLEEIVELLKTDDGRSYKLKLRKADTTAGTLILDGQRQNLKKFLLEKILDGDTTKAKKLYPYLFV